MFLPSVGTKGSVPASAFLGPGGTGRPYQDTWSLDRVLSRALERVTPVFRCVHVIAAAQANLRAVAHVGDREDGPEADAAVLALLNEWATPDEETAWAFRYRLSAQILLSRMGAFVEVGYGRDGRVLDLSLLPAGRTFPVPGRQRFVDHFVVRVSGRNDIQLPPERVLWFRLPHPTNPYRGLTPMETLGLAAETDWMARLFDRNVLANDGGHRIVTIKGKMRREERDVLEARYGGGPSRAGETSVVEAEGVDVADLGMSPRDAMYVETREVTLRELLGGFGVPESVAYVNASERTYANAREERVIFWLETMRDHLGLVAQPLDRILDDGALTWFDLEKVPAIAAARRDDHRFKLEELRWGAISGAEYRAETGRDEVPAVASRGRKAAEANGDAGRERGEKAARAEPFRVN